MIISSIHYTFAAEDAGEVELLFRALRDASVKESGVIQFDIGRSSDDPGLFALWEVYRDRDAVIDHYASEHFARLVINGIRPLARLRTAVNATPICDEQ